MTSQPPAVWIQKIQAFNERVYELTGSHLPLHPLPPRLPSAPLSVPPVETVSKPKRLVAAAISLLRKVRS